MNRNGDGNACALARAKCGRREGVSVEAYLALDLFGSFCIKAKRT